MSDMATAMATALGDVAEALRTMADAVQGHRAYLEGLGFSPTASEAMAADLHHQMILIAMRVPDGAA